MTDPTATAATPASVVQSILDDCLDSDRAFRSGDEYQFVKSDTADRIVAALRKAGMLRD